MKHTDRVSIAKKILSELEDKYKEEIQAGGIYGSVAREEDTEYSDLDMILITSNREMGENFLFDGVPVSYWSTTLEEAEDMVGDPDVGWPWSVNTLINFEVMIGDERVRERLKEMAESIPIDRFKEAVKGALPDIYAYHNKINRYYTDDEIYNLKYATWEMINGISGALALLNKEYFIRNDFYRVEESFQYSKTPEGYEGLVRRCYSDRSPEEVVRDTDKIFDNFIELLKKNGIKAENYSELEDIEL